MESQAAGTPVGAARGEVLSIQYLRAAAAIGVLIFHAADRTGWRFGPGAAGVDVFFVISGFIMWVIGARGSPTPLGFLKRRAQRILPLYWIVSLTLAGAWLAAPGLFPNLRPTPSHVVLSLLLIPHADPAGVVAPLVAPGWTLTYEAFFYVVFAASLLAPARARLPVLTATLGLLALSGLLLRPQSPIAATYASPLLLEFIAGVWIGRAWTRGWAPPPRLGAAMLVAGLAGLSAVSVIGMEVDRWRVLAWGAPAILIVSGGLGLERAGWVSCWRAPKLLGDASYSLYLVHGLAISVAIRGAVLLGIGSPSLVFAACVAVGLTAGLAAYVVVERPMTQLLHRRGAALTLAAKPG